jgi:hypothetical protein
LKGGNMGILEDLHESAVEEKECKMCRHCGDYEAWENGLVYESEICGYCEDNDKWEIIIFD